MQSRVTIRASNQRNHTKGDNPVGKQTGPNRSQLKPVVCEHSKKIVCAIDYTNMQSKLTVQSNTIASSKTNVGVCTHVEVNSQKEKYDNQAWVIQAFSRKHGANIKGK